MSNPKKPPGMGLGRAVNIRVRARTWKAWHELAIYRDTTRTEIVTRLLHDEYRTIFGKECELDPLDRLPTERERILERRNR